MVNMDSIEQSKTGILIFIKSDLLLNNLRPGDKIWLKGKLNEIESKKFPFEIDWAQHYANKGIHYNMFVKKASDFLIVEDRQIGIKSFACALSENMVDLIEKNQWSNHTKQIVKAMVLGDKNEMSVELRDAFSKSGVIHVLAVSGLHVGIIFLFVRSILLILGINKNHRFIYTAILIFSIWFYALVTGLASSVARASFMFTLIIFGEAIRRKSSIYNTIACSAFFILLLNPNRLFDLGFLLSYSAVLGIVSIYPMLKVLVYHENIFFEKIWSALSVSIAAQIGTLPLILNTFNVFPVYFLAANLIAIPLTGVIVVFSLIHLFIQSISVLDFISPLTAVILEFLIHYMFEILNFISELPYSTVNISLNNNQFLLLTGMICLLVYSMYLSKRKSFIISLCLIPLICLLTEGGLFREKEKSRTYFINFKNNLFLGKMNGTNHILLPLTDDSLTINEVSEKALSYFQKQGFPEHELIHAINKNERKRSVMEINIDEEKHLLINSTVDDTTLSRLAGCFNLRTVIFTDYPNMASIYPFKDLKNTTIILPSLYQTDKFGKTADTLKAYRNIWQPEYKDYLVLFNPDEE